MSKKEDLRVTKTKMNLYEALMKLMKEKTFEEIKVSDICNVALTNRSTFYDHFADKYELLDSLINDLEKDLIKKLEENNIYSNAKEYYMRVRPFSFFNEMTCNPEQQEELSTNGSYPSGHTAIGWATALVLAEVNPDRQNEILKRGFEMGQSRVICGYHFQSDVDAARIVASAVVARLHANDAFVKQLNKAKDEFSKLQKAGLIQSVSKK